MARMRSSARRTLLLGMAVQECAVDMRGVPAPVADGALSVSAGTERFLGAVGGDQVPSFRAW